MDPSIHAAEPCGTQGGVSDMRRNHAPPTVYDGAHHSPLDRLSILNISKVGIVSVPKKRSALEASRRAELSENVRVVRYRRPLGCRAIEPGNRPKGYFQRFNRSTPKESSRHFDKFSPPYYNQVKVPKNRPLFLARFLHTIIKSRQVPKNRQ